MYDRAKSNCYIWTPKSEAKPDLNLQRSSSLKTEVFFNQNLWLCLKILKDRSNCIKHFLILPKFFFKENTNY